MRDLVRRYLNEPIKLNRVRIVHELPSEEGADAGHGWRSLLAHMKPPYDLPEPVSEKTPGYYDLEVPVLPKESPVHYFMQLPPEYNPYRRYPMIVTLHGAGTTAEQQIDWWAGELGQQRPRPARPTRHGYIVMAPEWTAEHQDKYDYSAREHAIVLGCYRDACRRFAVDTDRVFLSGHSMGGDAAWDIGLAHPDLWAGVIPIVGRVRPLLHPLLGERQEPALLPRLRRAGRQPDDQERPRPGPLPPARLQRHRGRVPGPRPRALLRRDAAAVRLDGPLPPRLLPPRVQLRDHAAKGTISSGGWSWPGMPPRSMVDPGRLAAAPRHPAGPRQGQHHRQQQPLDPDRARAADGLAGAGMFDFKRPISIVVNGRKMNNRTSNLAPNLETLLEDVRTRGDRQHPFWAKIRVPHRPSGAGVVTNGLIPGTDNRGRLCFSSRHSVPTKSCAMLEA